MIDPRFYELIDRLHCGGDYYRYYWNPSGGENGSKLSMWFNSEYSEVPTIWQNSDLYFSVHPSDKRKSSHARAEITDIAAVNCLFAEFDVTSTKDAVLADIRKLSTPPSVIIDSGGGYHCYWLLDSTFKIETDADRERIQNIQYAWISFIDSSDDGAKDLARVLRVPGTKNNKYDQPLTVAFVEYDIDRTYNLDALEKLVQPLIDARRAQDNAQVNSKTSTPIPLDDQEIIDRMLASKAAGIVQLWNGDTSAYGNDHSDADQALCNHLAFWFGGDAERMDRAFRQSGLYRDKWDRTDYRERTIDRSIRDCREHYDPNKAKTNSAAHRAAMGAVGLNGTQPAQASSQPQGNQDNKQKIIDEIIEEMEKVAADGDSSDVEEWAYNIINRLISIPNFDDVDVEKFALILEKNKARKSNIRTWSSTAKKTLKNNAKLNGNEWANYIKVLTILGFHFRMNELDDRVEVNGKPLNDGQEAEIEMLMRDKGFKNAAVIRSAYTAHAHKNRYNPIKEYLSDLKWDGDDHIGNLCSHIEDSHEPIVYPEGDELPVFDAFFRRWLIGAIAKIFEDGTAKAQNPMLVLDGNQNLGKSTFVRWLASGLNDDYYIEKSIKPDSDEHLRYLANKWIWEVAELGATTRKADREALKSFMTLGNTTFRPPYARNAVTKPTISSFAGTINNEAGFLTDTTGNRRFLIIHIKSMNWDYLKLDINQVWAQAMDLYRSGERWSLTPEEAAFRDASNNEYRVELPLADWLHKYYIIEDNPTDTSNFIASSDIALKMADMGYKDSTVSIHRELSKVAKDFGLIRCKSNRVNGYRGITEIVSSKVP